MSIAPRSRRRPLLEVVLACLGVLLLAQALIGALSLSALDRLVADTTADRVELMARQAAGQIENGLRLGKPLAQYFGLDAVLRDAAGQASDIRGIGVGLPDGSPVAGSLPDDAAALAAALTGRAGAANGVALRESGTAVRTDGARITLAVPLRVGAKPEGILFMAVERGAEARGALLRRNLTVLAAATLGAGLLLTVAFRYFIPLPTLAAGGRARFAVPLAALLLAQGVYAADTIATFRSVWLDVTRQNVGMLAHGLQRNLERVLGYGVPPDRMKGVEAPFARLAASFPAIAQIDLARPDGAVLNRADATGALPVPPGAHALARPGDGLVMALPLRANGQGHVLAQLVLRLDPSVIAAGVRSRVLDAATVAGVALVAAIEMLLLLSLVMNRAFSARATLPDGRRIGPDDQPEVGRIARPVMFGFLFAWALPLGFMPLYARTLIEASGGTAGNLLMALPISVEMGCGLLAALAAGALTDRRGWQMPVLAGLAVAVAGTLLCAAADGLAGFATARGLVGLGYGLTWMGLQGFVVTRSPAGFRGRNMASVIAGLFAGHLSGAAVGAMLMEQAGFRAVFVVGAVMLLLPLAAVLTLMRPYMGRVDAAGRPDAPRRGLPGWLARAGETARLLATRDFGLLLAGSVVPFSVAQVGLLSYALPLYLEAEGTAASSVGRVLMLYGLCVIYLGPVMGRLADGSPSKKPWIVAGGLIGSVGMLGLYAGGGVVGAALAVLMLAVASCFAGASQSAYMLALDDVQRYGAAGATSLMRAADKLGQMAGPLFVGGMFTLIGMPAGLAMTGAVYLIATLAFLAFAPGRAQPAGQGMRA